MLDIINLSQNRRLRGRKVIYLAIRDVSKKMEYADPELAAGDELYYRVR